MAGRRRPVLRGARGARRGGARLHRLHRSRRRALPAPRRPAGARARVLRARPASPSPTTPGRSSGSCSRASRSAMPSPSTSSPRASGHPIEAIHVVGGGSNHRLLCRLTAGATGLPVRAGPVEATAIGNLAVQAIAAGELASVAEARELVARSFPVTHLRARGRLGRGPRAVRRRSTARASPPPPDPTKETTMATIAAVATPRHPPRAIERIEWAMSGRQHRDPVVGLRQHRDPVPRLPAAGRAADGVREDRRRRDRQPLHRDRRARSPCTSRGTRSTTTRRSRPTRASAACGSAASTATRSRTRTTSSARSATRTPRVRAQGRRRDRRVLRDRRRDERPQAVKVWLGDGTNYPGQDDLRWRRHRLVEGLREVYPHLPGGRPPVPRVQALRARPLLHRRPGLGPGARRSAAQLGDQAGVCVDTGHHAMGVNIEQIVALLLAEGRLAAFDLNDKKYGDDDLMVGSHRPVPAVPDRPRARQRDARRRRPGRPGAARTRSSTCSTSATTSSPRSRP